MSSSQIRERERDRALPTAVAALAVVALLILGVIVKGSSESADATTESQLLASFDRGPELLSALLFAFGLGLLAVPLTYLFRAAAARSESMKQQLIGVAVGGPLLLGLGMIALWLGFDAAATEFTESGEGRGIPVGEYAEDVVRDQTWLSLSQGLSFAGGLGTGIIIFYASRHALRTGLLTRFTGSLGMAVGVIVVLFALSGPGIYGALTASFIALFFYLFLLQLGLTFGGWRRGGRPPAWEQGRAVPWPAPGQREAEPEPDDPDRPADPDEFAAAIEGSGTEVGDEEAASPRKRKRRG